MNIKINDVTFVSCSVQHDFMATLHLSNHTSYVLIKTFHNFVSAQTVNMVNVCKGVRPPWQQPWPAANEALRAKSGKIEKKIVLS